MRPRTRPASRCAGGTIVGELAHRLRRAVVDDAVVSVLHYSADDVRSHPPKSDHSKLHPINSHRPSFTYLDVRVRLRSGADVDGNQCEDAGSSSDSWADPDPGRPPSANAMKTDGSSP